MKGGICKSFKWRNETPGNILSTLDQRGYLSVPPHTQCIHMEKEEHLTITEQNNNSNLRMLLTFKMRLETPLDTALASEGMLIRHKPHMKLFPLSKYIQRKGIPLPPHQMK